MRKNDKTTGTKVKER